LYNNNQITLASSIFVLSRIFGFSYAKIFLKIATGLLLSYPCDW